MNALPLIIPTLNRPTLLKQALDSAFTHAQNPIFPIVIDDHSREDVKSVCQPWLDQKKLAYYRMNRHSGPAICRTYGAAIAPAKHDYLYFSDADVYFEPSWDQLLIEAITRHPQFGLLTGYLGGRPTLNTTDLKANYQLLEIEDAGGISMMMSRNHWSQHGPFEPNKPDIPQEDKHLSQTFIKAGLKIGCLAPEVIIHTGINSVFWTQTADFEHLFQLKLKRPEILFE